MADTTTLNEQQLTPLTGSEWIRLATTGANWRAQTGTQTWFLGGIGVNESTLQNTVDWQNNSVGPLVQQAGVGNPGSAFGQFRWTADASPAQNILTKSRGSTVGTHGAVISADTVGAIVFAGDDGTNFQRVASMQAICEGTVSANTVPTRLIFTTTATNTATEAVRIDSTQKVNIGNQGVGVGDVHGSSPMLQISGVGIDNIDVRRYSADGFGPTVTGAKSRGTSALSNVSVSAGDILLELSGGGMDATATPILRQANQILFEADAAPTTTTLQGRIRFLTNNSSNVITEAVRVDSSQNVNIGNGNVQIANNQGNTPIFQISSTHDTVDLRKYSADAIAPNITSAKSHNATLGTNTAVVSGDGLLQIIAGGYDATGTPVLRNSSDIIFEADGTPTAGSVFGRIRFRTCPSGSTTLTEAMRIDANQNVVHGTAALATNATNGFVYIPTCAGAPTGTPTSYTGRDPMIYDTTDHQLFLYDTNASAWYPALFGPVWTQTAPTPSPSGGSFGAASAQLLAIHIGRLFAFHCSVAITTLGGATGFITVPLGVTGSNLQNQACSFVDISNGSALGTAQVNVSGTTVQINPQTLAAHTYVAAGVICTT